MATQDQPFSVSRELTKLRHEKMNQKMSRVPPTMTIQRRPINHAAIASPFASSQVQKVVYVSKKTPLMSAVKRVKRLLHEIEKRAAQDVRLIDRGDRAGMKKLAEAREKLGTDGETVLVKASGRAMEQALRVGEWFRTKEPEMACKVEVRPGSVSVVDDIVEVEDAEEADRQVTAEQQDESSMLEGGDTTLELLGDLTKSTAERDSNLDHDKENTEPPEKRPLGKHRKRKRKKQPTYDPDEIPEQRLRWVKTVEIAISFKA